MSRLPGIEVALPEGGSPSSDWHQRDVDRFHLVECEVRTRVPGIPAPVVSLNQKAERGSAMRTSGESTTIVIGGEDVDP